MFGDKKPNCVILDEIDGADAKGAFQQREAPAQVSRPRRQPLRQSGPADFECSPVFGVQRQLFTAKASVR